MIDFEKELERYTPSTEIQEAEKAIQTKDITDMTDILLEMMEKNK